MVGSHRVPISHRLAPAEGTRSAGGAADGSCLARLWRACRASGRRMGFVCQAGRAARGIATDIRHGRERHPPCTDALCGFSHTDRTLTSCVCEADCWAGTSVASLSCWLDLPDRRRTDRLRSRRAVLDLSACGREGGSGHDKSVYASRLGSCDSGRPDDTAAVDGVLHLIGDRVCRMGSSPKHRAEAACKAGGVTADPIDLYLTKLFCFVICAECWARCS